MTKKFRQAMGDVAAFLLAVFLIGLPVHVVASVSSASTGGPAPATQPVIEVEEPDPTEEVLAALDQRLESLRQLTAEIQQGIDEKNKVLNAFRKANPQASERDIWLATDAVFEAADDVFTVDLIMSWLWEESRHYFGTVSHVGARGVAQVMPGTGMGIAARTGIPWDVDHLMHPEYSIRLGTAHLKELHEHYDGNLHMTFNAYLRGTGGAEKYAASRQREVSRYSSCIMERVGLDDGHYCRTLTRAEEGE